MIAAQLIVRTAVVRPDVDALEALRARGHTECNADKSARLRIGRLRQSPSNVQLHGAVMEYQILNYGEPFPVATWFFGDLKRRRAAVSRRLNPGIFRLQTREVGERNLFGECQ